MYAARYVAVDELQHRKVLVATTQILILSPFLVLPKEELERHRSDYCSQGRKNQATADCTCDSNHVRRHSRHPIRPRQEIHQATFVFSRNALLTEGSE